MSIYLSKGYETNQLKIIESETDDFETILNSKVTAFNDSEALESVKRHYADYFIAGELSKSIRSNDTLISKTLLALDYDDIKITEKEFKNHLQNKIGVLNYYAYPSISNGLKGTRYRLIIKTDRPFNREENKPLIEFITDQIGLPYDKASDTWSQLQGLKTTFESVQSFNDKCISNEGIGVLKVDNALQKMAERKPKKKKNKKADFSFKTEYNVKKFTASFMETLLAGVDEGNRDNWVTKQFGRMLSLGFNYTSAYEWIELVNREFVRPPLDDRDVNRIVMSIANKEKEKRNKAREG